MFFRNKIVVYIGKQLKIDGDNLRIFGCGKSIKLNIVQKLTVQVVLHENVVENATSYERFIYKHILYHSCNYKRIYKRNNSIIKTIHDSFLSIINILCVANVRRKEICCNRKSI